MARFKKHKRKARQKKEIQSPIPLMPAVLPDDILCYLGIDGGRSGRFACLWKDGRWTDHAVAAVQHDDHWKLDIQQNLRVLRQLADLAGGRNKVFVVYEEARRNPGFGGKNNFTNGQNNEFWRVLLSMDGFQFGSVDPLTWQAACFKGIKTKRSKSGESKKHALARIFHRGINQRSDGSVKRLDITQPNENATHRFLCDRL